MCADRSRSLHRVVFPVIGSWLCACLTGAAGCSKSAAPPPRPVPAPSATPAVPAPPSSVAASPSAVEIEERALREEQRREAERLRALFPESDDVCYLVGFVYNEQGDSQTAMVHWERALELDPKRADTCNNLAYAFSLRDQYDRAEALFRKAIALKPEFAEPRQHLGGMLMRRGRIADAIAVLRSAREPTAEIHALLGQAYQRTQDYARAEESYLAALKLNPALGEAFYGLAAVYARMGRTDKAAEYRTKFASQAGELQVYRRRIRSDHNPLTVVRQNVARTHTDVGRVFAAFGRGEDAERLWRRSAALDPANTESRLQLAQRCQQTKREAEALACYEEVTRIDPKNGLAFLQLGRLNARLQRWDEAEAAFTKLVELAPERPESHYALAQFYVHSNRNQAEGLAQAQEAVRLAPIAPHYALLGQARARSGDAAGALAAIEEACALDPANAQYRRLRDMLKEGK